MSCMGTPACSVSHGGSAVLVDEGSGDEALKGERGVVRVRAAVGDRVREAPADSGRGLDTARAPPTVEGEAVDGREAVVWGRVRRVVDEPAPAPEQVGPGEDREELQG